MAVSGFKKRERYEFIATTERDSHGYQIMKDLKGNRHLLTGTMTRYEEGVRVKCTVIGYGKKPVGTITGRYLVLASPRKATSNTRDSEKNSKPIITYGNSSMSYDMRMRYEKWSRNVMGLDRHKCGVAFVCNCCGKSFSPRQGYRVDGRDLFFCNSCAKHIFEPAKRGNSLFYISTPMGNKR